MNRTIFLATLRERFSAPNRWFAAVVLFAIPILTGSVGAPSSAFLDVLLVWLIGAGIVGEEVSSGTILLVLSRPVSRREYVLSKWVALSALAAGLFLLQAGLRWGVARWGATAYGGDALPAGTALEAAARAIFRGIGAAAVLMPFSVAIAGGKEISAIMLSWAAGTMVELFGKHKDWGWTIVLGQVITRFLVPTVELSAAGSGLASLPGQVAVFALTVAGALACAILLLERRELSYSAG